MYHNGRVDDVAQDRAILRTRAHVSYGSCAGTGRWNRFDAAARACAATGEAGTCIRSGSSSRRSGARAETGRFVRSWLRSAICRAIMCRTGVDGASRYSTDDPDPRCRGIGAMRLARVEGRAHTSPLPLGPLLRLRRGPVGLPRNRGGGGDSGGSMARLRPRPSWGEGYCCSASGWWRKGP